MVTEAYLSTDRRYRYWLLRVWDAAKPVITVIGVNPSTADEDTDDATIRKVIGFARRLGYGGCLMLNVAAFRATDPVACRGAYAPIGFFNTTAFMLETMLRFKTSTTVAAWGKNGRFFPHECQMILEDIPDLWCWGRNKDGTPRHPLMLPYDTPLERYERKEEQ